MANNLQEIIVTNLLYNEDYAHKVYPFTKVEYFEPPYTEIVKVATKFYATYGEIPKKDELKIELQNLRGITDRQLKEATEALNTLHIDPIDPTWLMANTEKFYKEQSVMNAIVESANILQDQHGTRGEILNLVQNALAVSFDTNVGHDYFEDYEKRFEDYHRVEDKVSWGIKSLDDVTNGGMSKKTLNCIVAVTGQGKSAMMCCISANVLRQGKNVLYISMEMSEDRVAERIDANMLHTTIDHVHNMSHDEFVRGIDKIRNKCTGKLVIKEFPTSGASAIHFRSLLEELKTKKHFTPDLIVIDYMNICSSSRVKVGQTNSYGFVKAISEELRGLAVEYNAAVLTATQTNRNGFNNSDIDLTDISESIGTTFVMDFQFAIIRTEQMDEQNQVMIKQLKNRYGDLTKRREIYLGFNRDEMRFYDADAEAATIRNTFSAPPSYIPVPKKAEEVKGKTTNDFGGFKF